VRRKESNVGAVMYLDTGSFSGDVFLATPGEAIDCAKFEIARIVNSKTVSQLTNSPSLLTYDIDRKAGVTK
jgi:hypothetical protein